MAAAGDKDKPDDDPTAPGGVADANVNGNADVAPTTTNATAAAVEDDEESDWEELDGTSFSVIELDNS